MNKLPRHLLLLTLAAFISGCASQAPEQEQAAEETTPVETRDSSTKPHTVTHPAVDYAQAELKNRAIASSLKLAETGKHYLPAYSPMVDDLSGENYAAIDFNGIRQVLKNPVSTFNIDVDSGAYSNMRRILQQGMLPPKNAVRTEELVNYFDYNYQAPESLDTPFLVNSSLTKAPWDPDKHLLQIGIKAWEQPAAAERKAANLVFLVDVSGSMNQANKLPLLKQSLRMMSKQMSADDRISIVVYAGASGVVLEPTPGNDIMAIEQALAKLNAGGSTNGEAGIKLAYQQAEQAYIKDGINRIFLATDGDFNVGQSDTRALIELIERKRNNGIALSTLGFGGGNYNDHMMEQLANHGNGNYSYIDNLLEARKVLVEELDSQLITVAKDVKLQIEFNPAWVAEYRLVGYENRVLATEDFNNDKVDAGEIGAGHTVTAIYELTLTDSNARSIEPLRYQQQGRLTRESEELGFMRIRYKSPEATVSQLLETPLLATDLLATDQAQQEDNLFSAAVIAFADKLQGGKYTGQLSFEEIEQLAVANKGLDRSGIRAEFARLVRLAASISQAS
jgi:Ca-activated chloride channel family protein